MSESLGRDPGVGSDSCWRPEDVGQWKKAVEDAVEERRRRRNVSSGQRRFEGLLADGVGRKDSSKDRKAGVKAEKRCFGCGEFGHLRKNCRAEKKESVSQERFL